MQKLVWDVVVRAEVLLGEHGCCCVSARAVDVAAVGRVADLEGVRGVG